MLLEHYPLETNPQQECSSPSLAYDHNRIQGLQTVCSLAMTKGVMLLQCLSAPLMHL